jgi:DNA invertase Pin-like site-specific DNA recombinase
MLRIKKINSIPSILITYDNEYLPKVNKMKNVVQYLRISTSRQNFEFQKDVLDLYCGTKGLIVKDTVKEVTSAWQDHNQPKLRQLINSIDNRFKDYSECVDILCLRPDRFSRNAYYAELLLNDLHKKQGCVFFVDRYGIRSSFMDKEKLLDHIRHSQYFSDTKSKDAELRRFLKKSGRIVSS